MERTVVVLLNFSNEENIKNADVKTNGIPMSLIVESLNNLVRALSKKLVSDAQREMSINTNVADYLDAQLMVDREKLKRILKEE